VTSTENMVHRIVAAMAPGDVPAHEEILGSHRLVEDLGYDSLRLMELTVALERAFDVGPYRTEELAGVRTVEAVVELVEASRSVPQAERAR
jgi:acyl carrier protein